MDEFTQKDLYYAIQYGELYTIPQMIRKYPPIINELLNGFPLLTLAVIAKKNSLELVKLFLSYEGIDVNKIDKNGYAALHHACLDCRVDIVAELLNHPEINVNVLTTKNGDTPIFLASAKGLLPIVEILLKSSKEINTTLATKHNQIPLSACCFLTEDKSNYQKIRNLIEKYQADHGIETAPEEEEDIAELKSFLERAIIQKSLPSLMKLSDFLEAYPQLLTDELLTCGPALTLAVYCEAEELVEFLLSFPFIDVNKKSERSDLTALAWSCIKGNLDIVKLLLIHPDIDVNARTKDGETAFWFASISGHLEIVQLLLSLPELDVISVFQSQPSLDSRTKPLKEKKANREEHPEENEGDFDFDDFDEDDMFEEEMNKKEEEKKKELKKLFALVITQNDFAALEKLSQLIEVFPYILTEDLINFGPALSLSVYCESEEFVEFLLQLPEIDVNRKSQQNEYTALYWSCIQNNVPITKLLLAHPNIDVNFKTSDGKSAVMFASHRGCVQVVKLLLSLPSLDLLSEFECFPENSCVSQCCGGLEVVSLADEVKIGMAEVQLLQLMGSTVTIVFRSNPFNIDSEVEKLIENCPFVKDCVAFRGRAEPRLREKVRSHIITLIQAQRIQLIEKQINLTSNSKNSNPPVSRTASSQQSLLPTINSRPSSSNSPKSRSSFTVVSLPSILPNISPQKPKDEAPFGWLNKDLTAMEKLSEQTLAILTKWPPVEWNHLEIDRDSTLWKSLDSSIVFLRKIPSSKQTFQGLDLLNDWEIVPLQNLHPSEKAVLISYQWAPQPYQNWSWNGAMGVASNSAFAALMFAWQMNFTIWIDCLSIPLSGHSLKYAFSYMGSLYASYPVLSQVFWLQEGWATYLGRGWVQQEILFTRLMLPQQSSQQEINDRFAKFRKGLLSINAEGKAYYIPRVENDKRVEESLSALHLLPSVTDEANMKELQGILSLRYLQCEFERDDDRLHGVFGTFAAYFQKELSTGLLCIPDLSGRQIILYRTCSLKNTLGIELFEKRDQINFQPFPCGKDIFTVMENMKRFQKDGATSLIHIPQCILYVVETEENSTFGVVLARIEPDASVVSTPRKSANSPYYRCTNRILASGKNQNQNTDGNLKFFIIDRFSRYLFKKEHSNEEDHLDERTLSLKMPVFEMTEYFYGRKYSDEFTEYRKKHEKKIYWPNNATKLYATIVDLGEFMWSNDFKDFPRFPKVLIS